MNKSKKNSEKLSASQQKAVDKLLARWDLNEKQLTPSQKRVVLAFARDNSAQLKSYLLIFSCVIAMIATAVFRCISTFKALDSIIGNDVILYKVVTERQDHVVDPGTVRMILLQYFNSVVFASGLTIFAIALLCFAILTFFWNRRHGEAIDIMLDSISSSKTKP
jgi:hypothetical protein